MMSIEPEIQHFDLPNSLAIDVVDSFDGDSARGYFQGEIKGAVRPLLNWETTCHNEIPQAMPKEYRAKKDRNQH
jgi:hypothetical protein